MRPTLLILAAGAGSRYGGLKQLDAVGPNGETIMDYSVYDAVRAGFGKVVFVVRHYFRDEFERRIVSGYRKIVEVELVEQEPDDLPEGFTLISGREKPWGTGHALLMASKVIQTPFAVINADDFYGKNSFGILASFLSESAESEYSMVGFSLEKTLSESGTVSRGICTADKRGFLTGVEEHHNVKREEDGIYGDGMDGVRRRLAEHSPTSMNMWGFTPEIFDYGEKLFKEFLIASPADLKREFYIPHIVNSAIEENKATVKILSTPDKWFGVTYKEDKSHVIESISQMVERGEYPADLYNV